MEDLQERPAMLCENVKTYHSETGFIAGFVAMNSGAVSNEGSTTGQAVDSELKDREALIVTFWDSFEHHEASHRSASFQPLFRQVLELCENGNEEIAYEMLWSGRAYDASQARAAREANLRRGHQPLGRTTSWRPVGRDAGGGPRARQDTRSPLSVLWSCPVPPDIAID